LYECSDIEILSDPASDLTLTYTIADTFPHFTDSNIALINIQKSLLSNAPVTITYTIKFIIEQFQYSDPYEAYNDIKTILETDIQNNNFQIRLIENAFLHNSESLQHVKTYSCIVSSYSVLNIDILHSPKPTIKPTTIYDSKTYVPTINTGLSILCINNDDCDDDNTIYMYIIPIIFAIICIILVTSYICYKKSVRYHQYIERFGHYVHSSDLTKSSHNSTQHEFNHIDLSVKGKSKLIKSVKKEHELSLDIIDDYEF
jgi:hypothetical protein